jgi:hypothetical protein
MPSERQSGCRGPPSRAATGPRRRSYLRIDVSLNTLFIFVRHIPRRWNPPRGEARSTANARARPRGYDISRDIKTRARLWIRGWIRAWSPRWPLCLLWPFSPPRTRQSTRRGLSPRIRGPYYTLFFLLKGVPAREKLVRRQCRARYYQRIRP